MKDIALNDTELNIIDPELIVVASNSYREGRSSLVLSWPSWLRYLLRIAS